MTYLKEREEVERTKVKARMREHSVSPLCEASASPRTKWVICVQHGRDLSNTQETKASQFEASTPLRITGKASHLVYVIALHLIRCVKKVKLAKITSQLFYSLMGRNSAF